MQLFVCVDFRMKLRYLPIGLTPWILSYHMNIQGSILFLEGYQTSNKYHPWSDLLCVEWNVQPY